MRNMVRIAKWLWGRAGDIGTAQLLWSLFGGFVTGLLTWVAGQPLWLVSFVGLGAVAIILIIITRLRSLATPSRAIPDKPAATGSIAALSASQLREEALRKAREIRVFSANAVIYRLPERIANKSETEAERMAAFRQNANRENRRREEIWSDFQRSHLADARTLLVEMRKRLGIRVSDMDGARKDTVLDHGMMAGATPFLDSAAALEDLANQL